jgi:L,D-transpeptidase catalytic domain
VNFNKNLKTSFKNNKTTKYMKLIKYLSYLPYLPVLMTIWMLTGCANQTCYQTHSISIDNNDNYQSFTKKEINYSNYPLQTINGKRCYMIPAEDFLMQKDIPVPVAPIDKGCCVKISLTNQRAWLYIDGVINNVSPVCTGMNGHNTPKGKFYVISKHKKWESTIYHVPMPNFLRLNPGEFGLHCGQIAMNPSSHGCIRLPAKKAEEFFEICPVGTKVFIQD